MVKGREKESYYTAWDMPWEKANLAFSSSLATFPLCPGSTNYEWLVLKGHIFS
jgi:hypothetical protein